MAYPYVYGYRCLMIMNMPVAGPPPGVDGHPYAEGYSGNTCILAQAGQDYLDVGASHTPGGCPKDNSTGAVGLWLGGNTVYVPGGAGNTGVKYCGKTYTTAEWEATGYDAGTTVVDSAALEVDTIIGWAKGKLGM